ncbi:class I SAM-dependent methyltransferase [uncultured Tateyamaria sp.]|uniref:class I SAM-dependent methyltransferase n=1 Tax=uncultured Tateyamaria sp. TaxID=455651 RepID=UPI0026149814|nr:class I SAM-dependent methyltransferase [uncultured Tateyamaria sp.]
MKKFAEITDDDHLSEAVEHAQSLAARLPKALDKNKLYKAAIDHVAQLEINDTDLPEGSFGYIPIDLDDFLNAILELESILSADVDYQHSELRHRPCSFLEVGCGTGRNVHLLGRTDRFTFDCIHGFDLSAQMIETGRQRYGLGKDIFVQDCLDFDYGGYDIVFFYCPMSDNAIERQFEERLIDTMKSGAFIVAFGDEMLDDSRKLIPKGDNRRIYKKM